MSQSFAHDKTVSKDSNGQLGSCGEWPVQSDRKGRGGRWNLLCRSPLAVRARPSAATPLPALKPGPFAAPRRRIARKTGPDNGSPGGLSRQPFLADHLYARMQIGDALGDPIEFVIIDLIVFGVARFDVGGAEKLVAALALFRLGLPDAD